MAAYMKFQEYLDRNKKVSNTAPVKVVADYDGPVDSKPPREKKHKNSGGKAPGGGGKPYKAGENAKDPNKGKLKDGFASKGDSRLEYEPDVKTIDHLGSGGKKVATWPKTKTQEWVERTKNMSLAEFTKAVRNEALRGLDECACQDTPHNNIKETVTVCKCNKGNISSLVREMKRNGLFGKLVVEIAQHPEAWKVLALMMEMNESYARKLVKAINEMVAPPMGDDAGMMPKKKKKPMKPPMLPHHHGHDDLDMDKGHPHDDLGGGPMGDDLGLDDEDLADIGGGEDDDLDGLGNEDDYPDGGGDMGDDDDMGGDDMDDVGLGHHPGHHHEPDADDMGGPPDGDADDMGGMGGPLGRAPHDKITPAKKKRKHAHHHIMNAIKDHPALNSGMGGGMMGGGM